MSLSERMVKGIMRGTAEDYMTLGEWAGEVANLEARLASARAIMEKFVGKVDRGMAKSVETYSEMKAWLEE